MPDFPTRASGKARPHEHLACGHKTGPRCIGSEPPPPDGDDAGGRLALKLTTGFFGSVLGIPRLPFGFTTGSSSGCNSGPQASPRNARPTSARSWARKLGATLGDRSCTSSEIEGDRAEKADRAMRLRVPAT